MGLTRFFSLLAVALPVLGTPVPGEKPDAETTVSSVTGTVTMTVTMHSSSSVAAVPNPATEVIVVTRTRTVTAYTKTTTLVSELNCTRTVLVAGSASAPVAATPVPAKPTTGVARRQGSTTIAAPTSAVPSSVAPPTTTSIRRRTRTSYVVSTVTPTGDLRRTRYECGNTLTYVYNIEATTTQWFTITSHPNVVTTTSLIACSPPAGAGRPPVPTSATARPPVPSSSSVAATTAAPTHTMSMPMFIRRDNTTTTAAAFKNDTVTLHITSTIYRFTTTVDNSTVTAQGYACSPVSSSVALSTTVAAPAPVTTSVTVLPRPTGSSAGGASLPSGILTLTRSPIPTVSTSLVPSPSPVMSSQ